MKKKRQNKGSPGLGFKLMEASLVQGFTSEPVTEQTIIISIFITEISHIPK